MAPRKWVVGRVLSIHFSSSRTRLCVVSTLAFKVHVCGKLRWVTCLDFSLPGPRTAQRLMLRTTRTTKIQAPMMLLPMTPPLSPHRPLRSPVRQSRGIANNLALDEPVGPGLGRIYLGILTRVLEALVPAQVCTTRKSALETTSSKETEETKNNSPTSK